MGGARLSYLTYFATSSISFVPPLLSIAIVPPISHLSTAHFILIGGKKVPVFSIMNGPQRTPDEVDWFLTQAARDAAKHFGF